MYYNEITDYLKSICNAFGQRDWFSPYFMSPENLLESEKETYPKASYIACFRSLGYTMGHVYLDNDLNILDFFVYDRNNIKDYEMTNIELQEELNKRFKGKKLIINGDAYNYDRKFYEI